MGDMEPEELNKREQCIIVVNCTKGLIGVVEDVSGKLFTD
jgi:hypothetical protein